MPQRRLLIWRAPQIARRVQAGQYVYVRSPAPRGLLLPGFPVAGFDRERGTIALIVDGRSTAHDLGHVRAGDTAHFEGPLGRGFRVERGSRHLLLVCDGAGLPRVRGLLDEAIASGCQVTLLLGAPSAAEVFPSLLLPDEAEYVVATADGSLGHAGAVTDLVLRYESWADQCFAAGSPPLLRELAVMAAGRDARLGVARLGRRRRRRVDPGPASDRRSSWLQVSLPHEVGCALGVCLGCVARGVHGPLRTCREGPVFSREELAWEEGG